MLSPGAKFCCQRGASRGFFLKEFAGRRPASQCISPVAVERYLKEKHPRIARGVTCMVNALNFLARAQARGLDEPGVSQGAHKGSETYCGAPVQSPVLCRGFGVEV